MKQIITIGRQFGSGGHEIGVKLSERLGIPLCDKEIIQAMAKKLGICENILSKSEESGTSSLLYSIVMGTRTEPFEDKLARYEAKYLREQASKGPCVIVGRCGNHIFRDNPEHISFFITAPMTKRIERITKLYNLSEKEAQKLIVNTDKKRANYYYYHTDQAWSDISQYQFILDSSVFGIDKTVDLIYNALNA